MRFLQQCGSPLPQNQYYPGTQQVDNTLNIVLFLRSQGTVLLRKPYYLGTDLLLKSRFMTFGFSKSPFFAHFQAILIFETKKVIIWFHFETFIELFIKKSDIFTRF